MFVGGVETQTCKMRRGRHLKFRTRPSAFSGENFAGPINLFRMTKVASIPEERSIGRSIAIAKREESRFVIGMGEMAPWTCGDKFWNVS